MTTAQRISLGGGKYCYSGPGCQWHSPTGTASIKQELRNATAAVAEATTMNEMFNARDRLTAASIRYDATPEGQTRLADEIADTDDHIEGRKLALRLQEAEKYAAQVEKDQEALWNESQNSEGSNILVGKSIALDNNHTYKVPTFNVPNPDDYYPATVGSKHDSTRWVPAKEIASNLRKDFKEAQDKGYLPKHLEFRVTAPPSRMYQTVEVKILGVTDAQAANPDDGRQFGGYYTPEAKELLERTRLIHQAYNSDSSNISVDYFQRDYGGSVSIEDENSKAYREKEAQLAKAKREIAPLKKALQKDFKNTPEFYTEKGVSFKPLKGGGEFGRIPGTDFFVVKRSITGPSGVYESARVYDFTGTAPKKGSFEETFSQMNHRQISQFSKKVFIG